MRIIFTGNEETVKKAEWCLEVFMGDYSAEQQYAASIMLKMLLKEEQYRVLMEFVKDVTPFKANDRLGSRCSTWKKNVKKNGVCEVCGSTHNLEAHHIIPWAHSIKGRFDVNNGQCLCKECHRMMHDDTRWVEFTYERRNNNEQRKSRTSANV